MVKKPALVSKEQENQLMTRSYQYKLNEPFISLDFPQGALKFFVPNQICVWRVLTLFSKEPDTISWINGFQENEVFFDVGANIGLYSLWAAFRAKSQVFSFEPEAENYNILNQNLRANDLTQRCSAYCMGVASGDEVTYLDTRLETGGASGHQVRDKAQTNRYQVGPTKRQGIITRSLDQLVYDDGLPCPSHIKIDVDGIEPQIIHGARKLLEDKRVKEILIELLLTDPTHVETMARIGEAGFSFDQGMLKDLEDKSKVSPRPGNLIFRRKT